MARITTPFSATSTAAEVIAGVDLKGRRALVTGGSSGIGVETARALAHAGADVTIAVRDLAAGEKVRLEIGRNVRVAQLDLAEPESVRAFVRAWEGPLHILVNNAGVMACPKTLTRAGWELQLATNHLGHFQLATGLHRALAAEGGRVVSVSSRGHLRSEVVFDDLFYAHRDYDKWQAYGQSKTANILFAVHANTRWAGDRISVNAVHPGAIATNLLRHIEAEEREGLLNRLQAILKTVEQGAAGSVLLAASPLVEGVGGRYFEDCNEALPNQPGSPNGVAEYALDPARAERLWEVSTRLLAEVV